MNGEDAPSRLTGWRAVIEARRANYHSMTDAQVSLLGMEVEAEVRAEVEKRRAVNIAQANELRKSNAERRARGEAVVYDHNQERPNGPTTDELISAALGLSASRYRRDKFALRRARDYFPDAWAKANNGEFGMLELRKAIGLAGTKEPLGIGERRARQKERREIATMPREVRGPVLRLLDDLHDLSGRLRSLQLLHGHAVGSGVEGTELSRRLIQIGHDLIGYGIEFGYATSAPIALIEGGKSRGHTGS